MNAAGRIRYSLSVPVILLLLSSCAGVSNEPIDTAAPPPTTTSPPKPTATATPLPIITPSIIPSNTPGTLLTPSPKLTTEDLDATSACDVSRDLGYERISVVGIVEKVDDAIWLADLNSDGCNLLIAVDYDQYDEWKEEVPEAFILGSRVWFDGILMVYNQIDSRLFDSHPPTPNPDEDYFVLKVDNLPKVIDATP